MKHKKVFLYDTVIEAFVIATILNQLGLVVSDWKWWLGFVIGSIIFFVLKKYKDFNS